MAITGGPPQRPQLYGLKTATVFMHALKGHRSGHFLATVEVQLDGPLTDQPWTTNGVQCDAASGLCSYTLPRMAVGEYLLQARALDKDSGVPGNPQKWNWQVAECNGQQFAKVGMLGNLTCSACPLGGNCTRKNTMLANITAQRGWWSPPEEEGNLLIQKRTFFKCPFKDSCVGGPAAAQCNTALRFAPSPVCAQCVEGSVRNKDKCVECPNSWLGISALLLGVVVVVGIVYHSLKSECKKLQDAEAGIEQNAAELEASIELTVTQRTLINYLNLQSSVGSMRIQGPLLLREFIGYSSSIAGGVSLNFYSSRCLLGLSFWNTLWGTLFLPFFFIAIISLLALCRKNFRKIFIQGGAVLLVYLKYPDCITMLLQGMFLRSLVSSPSVLFGALTPHLPHPSRCCQYLSAMVL